MYDSLTSLRKPDFDYDPNSAEHQLYVMKIMIDYLVGERNTQESDKQTFKLLLKRIKLYEKQVHFLKIKLAVLQKSYLLKQNTLNVPTFFNAHVSKKYENVLEDTSHVVTEDFYRKIIKYHNSSNKSVIETKLAIKNHFLNDMKKINENPIDIRIIVDSFDTNSFNKNTENAIFGENLNNEKKK